MAQQDLNELQHLSAIRPTPPARMIFMLARSACKTPSGTNEPLKPRRASTRRAVPRSFPLYGACMPCTASIPHAAWGIDAVNTLSLQPDVGHLQRCIRTRGSRRPSDGCCGGARPTGLPDQSERALRVQQRAVRAASRAPRHPPCGSALLLRRALRRIGSAPAGMSGPKR